LAGRIQLRLLPATVIVLHNSKTTKKQTKTFARAASSGQDTKMRVLMPVHQEVVTAIVATSVMLETSSMPDITDALQMKPIVFQPSV